MKLLVAGASGGTGRELVLQGLAAGHDVRAWSRTEGELGLRHARLTGIAGEAEDAERVRTAVRGVDVVLSAIGSQAGLRKTALCARAAERLVAAMRAEGVPRLVCVTSMGTTEKLGPLHTHVLDPWLLSGIYDDKRDQESIIRESGLEWVLVRPGRLTNGRDATAAEAVLDGPLPGLTVNRAAVARFMLGQLRSQTFLGLGPYLVEPLRPAWMPWRTLLGLATGADGRRQVPRPHATIAAIGSRPAGYGAPQTLDINGSEN